MDQKELFLIEAPDGLEIELVNGVAQPPSGSAAVPGGGRGLIGMRERVLLLGDWRIAYAPIEDLMFGFAMIVLTLDLWVLWGRRGVGRGPYADGPWQRRRDAREAARSGDQAGDDPGRADQAAQRARSARP